MKKQALTKQDIQKELLTKINKKKSVSIFATIIVLLDIPAYILLAIYYNNIVESGSWRHGVRYSLPPSVALYVVPVLLLFLIIYFLKFYYIDLYRAKRGKFEIIEDAVCRKEKEWRHYYRNSQKENSLYFRCGRVAVEDKVYSYSNVGDKFYIVILKSKKHPQLAYHTKYYEINLD